jgi:hypothetical protein
MPSLRQRLLSESPELHAALLRSWEIAQNEWLPAIVPSEGSFNSRPHFTNIERHLEALLGPAAESAATGLQLTGLEVYLLLASVLFHDLGRVHGDAEHAYASARDLQDHFAALGIPCFELAASLARIARYHDPKKAGEDHDAWKNRLQRVKRMLRDIRLEPHGTARELYVGTLLTLADHMDGSYLRALPRYVVADEVVGFKGAFRRLVSGTGYDPATCTLKTCLSGFAEATKKKRGAFDYRETYSHFQRARRGSFDKWEDIPKTDCECASKGDSCDLFRDLLVVCCPELHLKETSKMFRECLLGTSPDAYIIRRREWMAEGRREGRVEKAIWPPDYLLGVVLNDLGENLKCLEQLRGDACEMGLPVDGWFIEFDSEVYDSIGNRTHEPLLPPEYLCDVAREAWDLSVRLIGRRSLERVMHFDERRY